MAAKKRYIKKDREVPGSFGLDFFYSSLELPKSSPLLLNDPWLAMYLCREYEKDRKKIGWTAGRNITLSNDKTVFYADLTKINNCTASDNASNEDSIRKMLSDIESFCGTRNIAVFAFLKNTEILCNEGTGTSFHALTAKSDGSAGIIKKYKAETDDYLSLFYFFDPVKNRYFFTPKKIICKEHFMDNFPIKTNRLIIPCEREIKEVLNFVF